MNVLILLHLYRPVMCFHLENSLPVGEQST